MVWRLKGILLSSDSVWLGLGCDSGSELTREMELLLFILAIYREKWKISARNIQIKESEKMDTSMLKVNPVMIIIIIKK